jgi:hypothetical protein
VWRECVWVVVRSEERRRKGVEKVCAWFEFTWMYGGRARFFASQSHTRDDCTSHQPTLAFSPKLNAEHRAAPKKILAGQSRRLLPSHAIMSPVSGSTRELRGNRRSASCCWKVFPLVAMPRLFLCLSAPAALPCARTEPCGRLHRVENFWLQTIRTIVRRARACSLKPVLPHSAQ